MPESEDNALSPEQAAKLLKADLANMVKKVAGGRTLSTPERTLLQNMVGDNEDGPKVTSDFVKNQVELADALGVTRQTVRRWRQQEGNPGARSNGTYSLAEWKAWAETKGYLEPEEPKLSQTQLKARQLLLQNQKLEHQIARLKGEYVSVEQVEKWGAQLGMEIRKVVCTIHTIAPSIVGQTIAEAEIRLRELEDEILTRLSLIQEFTEETQPEAVDEDE